MVGENLFVAGAVSQELQNVGDADALAPDAGAASALAIFDHNSREPIRIQANSS